MATIFVLAYNGGTSDNRVMKQARALVAEGHDVHLFCGKIDGHKNKEIQSGVHVHRFPVFASTDLDPTDISEDLIESLYNSGAELKIAFFSYTRFAKQKQELLKEISELDNLKSLITRRSLEKEYKKYSGLKRAIHKIKYLCTNFCNKPNESKSSEAWVKATRIKTQLSKRVKTLILNSEELSELQFRARFGFVAANLDKISFNLSTIPARPSVIHAHDLYTLPAALMLAQRLGGKVIYDAHEIETERYPRLSPSRKSFIDRLERDCLSFVDAVVTVSDGCRAFYQNRFKRRAPTIVMNSPQVEEGGVYNSSDVRSLVRLDVGAPLIVFTGAVGKSDRGLDKVVAALAQLPGYHLAIVGPRHEINDPWLLQCAGEHHVVDRVHMLVPVAAHQVVGVIRTANAAICCHQDYTLNYRYAMPNKLFEAAFARVPICVSDLPDMRRFVEELGIGLPADQTDPDAIAAVLRRLVENRSCFRGNEDYERLLAGKYSWSRQAATLIQLYRDLSNGKDKEITGNHEWPEGLTADSDLAAPKDIVSEVR